ncbi:hypothetical protein RHSIM_Rhsim07G0120100 [Rhododendron simsii]|uniref:Cystatin domain-containing protein n=1 Tax=Rhododendron simsii TaxID=118357 RepID=A0A834GK66_RHOSS|nr:hypothetical protein RHSIM_Rhsim07G0120100 [Rhododendron simsii]
MKETWVGLDGLDRLANSQVVVFTYDINICVQGFDVGKYTSEVALSNPISEISLEEPSEGSDYSTKAAKMAIRDYNRKKRTKYQFVKLVRVCIGFCKGWMYYITFQAKQDGMAPSPPRNFQARVHRFMGMHIQFCREEKKPQLTEGTCRFSYLFAFLVVLLCTIIAYLSVDTCAGFECPPGLLNIG